MPYSVKDCKSYRKLKVVVDGCRIEVPELALVMPSVEVFSLLRFAGFPCRTRKKLFSHFNIRLSNTSALLQPFSSSTTRILVTHERQVT
jgi:hypothetical protein